MARFFYSYPYAESSKPMMSPLGPHGLGGCIFYIAERMQNNPTNLVDLYIICPRKPPGTVLGNGNIGILKGLVHHE